LLDPASNTYRIEGRSLPENAHQFYQPLIDWFAVLLSQKGQTVELDIYLDYYNSSTGRYLMELMLSLEEGSRNNNIGILWRADAEDEIMLEKGEEYRVLLKIPVQIQVVKG
jgi:hypothetical protein